MKYFQLGLMDLDPAPVQDAVRDMMYLKECNDEMEFKLKQAADWELDIART